METDPELIFLDQIELRGHGLAGEGREELEEPRDELGGQLLRLHALPLHRRYDPLVVTHVLQRPKVQKRK